MKNKKSKKDLAFDRERSKYRHKIFFLQREIKENIREIESLNRKILELEESIREKDEWINRLLEYTELTEEDMKNQIQKDKSVSEMINRMEKMNSMICGLGKSFGL